MSRTRQRCEWHDGDKVGDTVEVRDMAEVRIAHQGQGEDTEVRIAQQNSALRTRTQTTT